MPSLKDLRNRISSVKATQKITKAMQMVAAAKLRRAQEAVVAARPYSDRMSNVLTNLALTQAEKEGVPKLLGGTGKEEVHLLVVCTAERGLCGGFNSSIAKLARETAQKLLAENKKVKILCVGKKGNDALKREFGGKIVGTVELRDVKRIGFANADAIGDQVREMFDMEGFDVCTLFFSRFESVAKQTPTTKQLIPVEISSDESGDESNQSIMYEYEPDETSILEDLLPRNISVQIFRGLLENAAGEMGAKMMAMDNATRNAGEMIDKLTISYNRQRQAQITKELIEIISGAEAL